MTKKCRYSGFTINYLGNNLLSRFNLIFDFRHDYVYTRLDKWAGMALESR